MRVALDTNILAYAEGVNGPSMRATALRLIARLPQESVVLPVQVLGELFQVLVRKAGRAPAKARAAVLSWSDAFVVAETSGTILLAAAELAVNHQLGIWDAVVLSAAAEANCRLLLSEDMHNGFLWKGTAVANPFAAKIDPLLQSLLSREP